MSTRETAYLTADVVALADDADGTLHVLLIRRAKDPHVGRWVLPGGHVESGERTEIAARRELAEETGIEAGETILVGVYADPSRDPRGRYVSFAYSTRLSRMVPPTAGDDAAVAEWLPVDTALSEGLAFDHEDILRDALPWRPHDEF